MKNGFTIKTNIVTLVLVFLAAVTGYAQEPTDVEIGFDRNATKKELMSGGFVNEAFVEKQLDEIRKSSVERYRLGFDNWLDSKKPKITLLPKIYKRGLTTPTSYASFQNCETFTFNDPLTPLNGWRLSYNIAPYSYNDSFAEGVMDFTGSGDNFLYDEESSILIKNNRFQVFKPSDFTNTNASNTNSLYEPFLGVIPASLNPTNVIRIGNRGNSNRKEMISKTFTISNLEDFLLYNYAIVLEDPGHDGRPFYSINVRVNGERIECSVINYEANKLIPGFKDYSLNNSIKIRPWSTNIIKPSDFGAIVGDQVTIEVAVSDCSAGGHFGYGYFDIQCVKEDDIIKVDKTELCLREKITFSTQLDTISRFYWKIKNSNGLDITLDNSNLNNLEYLFTTEGKYTIELNVPYFTTSTSSCGVNESIFKKEITVTDCYPCTDCTSFDLSETKPYLISGWVKVGDALNPNPADYQNAIIEVVFTNIDNQVIQSPSNVSTAFKASGAIIEGWQRVIGEFQVPTGTSYISIDLGNTSPTGQDAYFDDIRVIPSDANMKSFVYDQQTQRLMSELDENNYSTFYEYDQEGGLIRIKKETERGVFTIQETRSNNRKIENNNSQ